MLEHRDRVVPLQGGVEQTDVVVRRGRRDDRPPRGRGEDAGRVHGVLRAVPGPAADLDPEHVGHGAVAAEHVPHLPDLVEELVRGDPDEVRVHQLGHRAVPAVQRQTAGEADEGVLRDRGAEHPVGVGRLQVPGRAARATLQLVDVLPHDDDPVVGGHPAVHDVGDHVDELPLHHRALVVGLLHVANAVELGQVAPDPGVDPGRVGQQCRAVPPRAGLAVGIGLEEARADLLHGLLAPGPQVEHGLLVQQTPLQHVPGDPDQRIAVAPGLLLVLGPVAERTPGERPVLVEVAVDVGLDERRPATAAHHLQRLLHGQVHGQRVHTVDPPARDGEAEAAGGQPGLTGRLLGRRGHRVVVVLDEEADRHLPGAGEVEGLEHRTDVDGPVAEVGHGHRVGPGLLVGPREPGGLGHRSPDDGVGPQRARLLPLQVHRATTAPAVPGREATDLGHGPLEDLVQLRGELGRGVQAVRRDVPEGLGQELVVAPVGAGHLVVGPQRQARADRPALLTDAGVRRAVDQTLAREVEHLLLEGTDEVQLHEHGREELGRDLLPVLLGAAQLHPARGRQQRYGLRHDTTPGSVGVGRRHVDKGQRAIDGADRPAVSTGPARTPARRSAACWRGIPGRPGHRCLR